MPSTVVVRGSGGALFERDVPTAGHALEIWNEQIAKGDIVIIDEPTKWVEAADGTRNLVIVEAEESAPRKPGRPPKAKAEPEQTETVDEPNEE